MSHFPWLFDFLLPLLNNNGSLKFLQNLGADMVRKRIESGSKNRDLFHFLVSLPIEHD